MGKAPEMENFRCFFYGQRRQTKVFLRPSVQNDGSCLCLKWGQQQFGENGEGKGECSPNAFWKRYNLKKKVAELAEKRRGLATEKKIDKNIATRKALSVTNKMQNVRD